MQEMILAGAMLALLDVLRGDERAVLMGGPLWTQHWCTGDYLARKVDLRFDGGAIASLHPGPNPIRDVVEKPP